MKDINWYKELFADSQEGLIIAEKNKNILFMNPSARKLFGNITSLSDVEHQFNFDLCILDEENILKYNPVTAIINSEDSFKTEAVFQLSQDKYKTLILKSINFDDIKIIIISDLSFKLDNQDLIKQNDEYKKIVNKLEQENDENTALKEKASSQAVRIALIHGISNSIRDTLDINDIINTALSELSKTLGLYKTLFIKINNNDYTLAHGFEPGNKGFSLNNIINNHENHIIKELIASNKPDLNYFNSEGKDATKSDIASPILYHGKILGIILLYHSNSKKLWHTEEISLIEGISAQLAAAIYQATLFEELELQNKKLELTLKQLKNTQTQLIQSEKMASLGQLVAGVAHEINTPLGAINSNHDIISRGIMKLKSKNDENAEFMRIFNVLEEVNIVNNEAINRINNIVKALKNFARLDEAEVNEIDIHEGIKSTLSLINHEIKNRIDVIKDFVELPKIKCYPNLINQVFMNILVNAYQSIEDKGTITIKTEKHLNKVKIYIKDSGKGIEPKNLAKIFNPGFTTKGVGVGTGLGLAICYQIIEKHNGSIKVNSKPATGSEFIIELPLNFEN